VKKQTVTETYMMRYDNDIIFIDPDSTFKVNEEGKGEYCYWALQGHKHCHAYYDKNMKIPYKNNRMEDDSEICLENARDFRCGNCTEIIDWVN